MRDAQSRKTSANPTPETRSEGTYVTYQTQSPRPPPESHSGTREPILPLIRWIVDDIHHRAIVTSLILRSHRIDPSTKACKVRDQVPV